MRCQMQRRSSASTQQEKSAEQANNNATAEQCNVQVFFLNDTPNNLSPGKLLKPCMYMSRRRRIKDKGKKRETVSEIPNTHVQRKTKRDHRFNDV